MLKNNFLIDTHCHLNMEQFAQDRQDVINRSFKNGVKYIQTICTMLSEFDDILEIANNNENIYCSVGVHPCNVKQENIPKQDELFNLAKKNKKVISFGETGLDYYHSDKHIQAQQESFRTHLRSSSQALLPVVVHTRDAEEDTINILNSEFKNSEFTGVIHCFTASYEFAKRALDLGFFISFAGIVTFKNARNLQETASKIPLDRILVETDAPFLAPSPHRGKRNEPAYTYHTAEYLAQMHNKSLDEIAHITTDNARRLFTRAKFI